MNQTTSLVNSHIYPYSKKNSLFYTAVFSGVTFFFVPTIIRSINTDNFTWLLFLLVLACLPMLIWLLVKQLIPALRGAIALEINSTEIVSYVEGVTIEWKDIKSIEYDAATYSSNLNIKLKWETDHGSKIRIKLQYVAGDDQKIYETAMDYLNRR